MKDEAPTPGEVSELVALFNAGCHAELESRTRLLLEQYPDSGFAWKALGVSLRMQGKEALPALQKATRLLPDDADAYNNLGLVLQDLGQLDDAVASYRRALQIKPDYAEAHNNLGNVLKDLGQLDDAVACYRRALQIKPDFAETHSNLGVALHDLGQLDHAVASYLRALQIKPDYVGAHSNLGTALKDLGQLADAVASYRRALQINPDFAEAHSNLAVVLHDRGQLDDAVVSYRRALQIKPDFVEAHNNLGTALKDLGQLDDAVANYRRALQIRPDYAEAHSNLGNALRDLRQLDDAAASYRRALQIKPDFVEAHSNLGVVLHDLGQLDDAVANYRRALQIKPDCAEAHNNLGNALKDLGQLDDAVTSYRRALQIKPDYAEAYSNLLFLYGYHALLDPQEYLVLARNWERACLPAQNQQTAHHRTFQREPLAGRKLRVGYVSGDYRRHAISYFVEQLFACHDRTQIELFAYATHSRRDDVTERLQALTDHWASLVGISDSAAAGRIERDRIDVLIDLSGHTGHTRLGMFSCRAAPVQAHYLGFFASTGLTEMDYWIGDEVLTPRETDNHFTERVWRLPRVWVSYEGKADAPRPGWQPSKDGKVWIGSFNNLGKLTPATLALWAKVLNALPEGSLLLKTKELRAVGNRQRILDVMFAHGISPNRIELQDSTDTPDWSAHMARYNRLDIALDPVGGVGGGTTTCDALWMAVPVINLKGDRMASRMTASMLEAIGHPEWIACSEADYIDKVVALARNAEQRRELRLAQRNKMAQSPLCDARGLARSLEHAYVEMFNQWLGTQNEAGTSVSVSDAPAQDSA